MTRVTSFKCNICGVVDDTGMVAFTQDHDGIYHTDEGEMHVCVSCETTIVKAAIMRHPDRWFQEAARARSSHMRPADTLPDAMEQQVNELMDESQVEDPVPEIEDNIHAQAWAEMIPCCTDSCGSFNIEAPRNCASLPDGICARYEPSPDGM